MCTLKLGLYGDKYSQRKNFIVKPKKGTKPQPKRSERPSFALFALSLD